MSDTQSSLPVISLGALRGKVTKKNSKKERTVATATIPLHCYNIHWRHINIVSLLY